MTDPAVAAAHERAAAVLRRQMVRQALAQLSRIPLTAPAVPPPALPDELARYITDVANTSELLRVMSSPPEIEAAHEVVTGWARTAAQSLPWTLQRPPTGLLDQFAAALARALIIADGHLGELFANPDVTSW